MGDPETQKRIEEGADLVLDFSKIARVARGSAGVLPVVVQNADTRDVLLTAYTNEEAFRKTVATGSLVLWSTTRNELWEKGKTSGETFEVVEIRVNCEQNSLLYLVRPRRGGICHTANRAGRPRSGCYYRRLDVKTMKLKNTDP